MKTPSLKSRKQPWTIILLGMIFASLVSIHPPQEDQNNSEVLSRRDQFLMGWRACQEASAAKPDKCKLFGKIKFVDSFPDVKVKVVDSFPDIRVKKVSSFPDGPGKWKIVDSFPDFKVQIVDSFPDIKIKYVDSFPGCD